MSSHPINLGVRFILELTALLSLGVWGWYKGEGWLRFGLALFIPLLFAALWGIFRVPGDPGTAPVPTPGIIRLAFELVYFSLATWALYDAHFATLAWVQGILVVLHYIVSYDRILWMIKQ
ncbi:MAG: YrdB family protein [Anaerolineae bacterium]|nr:YrdB family protein [Anaerolineae bacterium]